VIIVQKEFAEKNKELLDKFLDEYKESVNFVNSNTDEAAKLIEKYGILPNAQVAKNAIPYSNIVYRDAIEAKESLQEIYKILYSFEPNSVGGKIADDGFYYKK
ncbi:MAG TPA: ABC transporter substrate-binding protein, partial [Acetivibrio saccincola]|nr:ABC transporter substrate-binding protein [Acetivibrio saccincola]